MNESKTPQTRILNEEGSDVPPSTNWRHRASQHPQQVRPRRIQPYGRPDEIDLYEQETATHTPSATHVTVNNNSQLYRPWREELYISGWRTFGNFLGWPFRLVGKFIESIVTMFAGVLRTILLIVIAPTLLFTGLAFYQGHKTESGTQMASEIGREGVHLVGAVIGGVWHGLFGGGEKPAPEKAPPAQPQK